GRPAVGHRDSVDEGAERSSARGTGLGGGDVGQRGHSDGHGRRRAVGGTVIDTECEAVRPREVVGRRVSQRPGVDVQAADGAVSRGRDNRKRQWIVFYITAGQSDRFGSAGRRADTLGVGDRRVVDRRGGNRNGGDGAGQGAVIDTGGEPVRTVVVGR